MNDNDRPQSNGDQVQRRRRSLDEVFGEVLPTTTRDERDDGARGGFSDDWYRQNRPPHHEQ
ncbi:hypothetical protein FFT09_12095 [Saccharomonospora piscinae]|uniref:hypothetical protein n=1 Tax=Saccharomonospora piscinae TaxID=687388 RepID=UPI0011060B5E|nr:hypothetical protein [Saccharomonospora piscinae]TLW91675.1 hypothetical protein FFT09_12095 [Saccharomonospora piscinae]